MIFRRRAILREIEAERRAAEAARREAAAFRAMAREDRLAENVRRAGLGLKPIPLPEHLRDDGD